MKCNICLTKDSHSKVFNFLTEESFSIEELEKVFSRITAYDVKVEKGCKHHKGKATSLEQAIKNVADFKFKVKKKEWKIDTIEEWVEVLKIPLSPGCTISSDDVYWGTFFRISVPDIVCLTPDIKQLRVLFNEHHLDLYIACNGKMYTHNQIAFKEEEPGIFTVLKHNVYTGGHYEDVEVIL